MADAPLALTSYPLATEGTDPLRYAPIALTGVTISVAIDRRPDPFKDLPQDYLDAARTPFASVNLTPRLLAKLLTNSYRSSLPSGADTSYLPGTNPYNVTKDPDFLAVNDPEWAAQDLAGPAIADVIVPQGRSDAARAVWDYIAADADARAFLASTPDKWGMIVNPWYSTDPAKNPSGSAFSLARDDLPKADPVEYVPGNSGPVNVVTWRPYANDFGTVAYLTLRGDGQFLGGWDPFSIPPKYAKGGRMLPGGQALLGLTSSAAAARYQVVTASLRNPAGQFTSATGTGMLAAAAAMTTVDPAGRVLGFVPESTQAKGATTAYPLTLPVYAAANPAKSDAALRASYSAFITYAASGPAQTPGVDVGQLPDGYAPIPASWSQAAATAAAAIAAGASSAPPTSSSDGGDSGGFGGFGDSSSGGGGDTPQPIASGSSSTTLSSSTTPADPEVPAAPVIAVSLIAGAISALVSLIVSRRRSIRTWVRR
jgi:hypothetical protein